jgi:hypothetical protein
MTPQDCISSPVEPNSTVFQTGVPEVGAYAYDAVAAAALALDAVDDPTDGAALLATLSSLAFDGATGPLDFQDETFDRTPEGLPFILFNVGHFHGAPKVMLRPVLELRLKAGAEPELQEVGNSSWLHGTRAIPVDLTTVPLLCDPGFIISANDAGLQECFRARLALEP